MSDAVLRSPGSRNVWRLARLFGAMAVLSMVRVPAAAAQQPRRVADSVPLRADYRDLSELMSKLPTAAPPAFGESQAVALGAVQLPCIDRLQPRVPPRPGARDTPANDSTGGHDSTSHGSRNAKADSTAAANANSRGDGYFWVTTYTLVPRNNQTRAFWGCSDWHSAVSATWATAFLLQQFPGSALQDLSREKLADHLGASNLEGELEFFKANAAAINPIPFSAQRGLFERPYGFAWLLKLQSKLYTWPDSAARKWAANATPLASWMSDSLGAYVSTLPEPVRSAGQSNTALSLMLALDYANVVGDAPLREQLISNSRRFYMADKACKTQAEATAGISRGGRAGESARSRGGQRGDTARRASADTGFNDLTAPGAAAAPPSGFGGGDIVSPCLTEAALMAQVLSPTAYVKWLNAFLPPLESGRFSPLTEPAGGTLRVAAADSARLSGLSFQRAQAMERIAHALPSTDPRVAVLHRLSAIHADRGFELMRNEISAVSWLPAYALLYIEARKGS
jgi:DUF2891 family protein